MNGEEGGGGAFGGTYKVWLPQALAHAKELLRRRTRDNEILGEVDTANTIESADERLASGGVEASDHGADEVRAKTLLVEARGDEVGEGARGDGALLTQTIHICLVAEEIAHGVDIGGQAGETEEDVSVLEDLGEVVGHGEGLETETEIAGNGDAVLADHSHTGATICKRIPLLACKLLLANCLGYGLRLELELELGMPSRQECGRVERMRAVRRD
jgi:hypothetical protein